MKVIAAWIAVLLMTVGVGVGVEAAVGVGAPAILQHGDAAAGGPIIQPVQFQVFVAPTATTKQIAAVRSFLKESSGVASCLYLDHEQSYQLMKQVLKNEPGTWEAMTPAEVPPLFECVFRGSNPAPLAGQLRALPDIYSVDFPPATVFSGST
jgi:cell division protein FtsX